MMQNETLLTVATGNIYSHTFLLFLDQRTRWLGRTWWQWCTQWKQRSKASHITAEGLATLLSAVIQSIAHICVCSRSLW